MFRKMERVWAYLWVFVIEYFCKDTFFFPYLENLSLGRQGGGGAEAEPEGRLLGGGFVRRAEKGQEPHGGLLR